MKHPSEATLQIGLHKAPIQKGALQCTQEKSLYKRGFEHTEWTLLTPSIEGLCEHAMGFVHTYI